MCCCNMLSWNKDEDLICHVLMHHFDDYNEVADWMNRLFYPRFYTSRIIKLFIYAKTDQEIYDRSPLSRHEIWYMYQYLRNGVHQSRKEYLWKSLLIEFQTRETLKLRQEFLRAMHIALQQVVFYYVTTKKLRILMISKLQHLHPRVWLLLFYFSNQNRQFDGFYAELVPHCTLIEKCLSIFVELGLYQNTLCRWSVVSNFNYVPFHHEHEIVQGIEAFSAITYIFSHILRTLYRVIVSRQSLQESKNPEQIDLEQPKKFTPKLANIHGYLNIKGINKHHARIILDSYEGQTLIGILSQLDNTKTMDQVVD